MGMFDNPATQPLPASGGKPGEQKGPTGEISGEKLIAGVDSGYMPRDPMKLERPKKRKKKAEEETAVGKTFQTVRDWLGIGKKAPNEPVSALPTAPTNLFPGMYPVQQGATPYFTMPQQNRMLNIQGPSVYQGLALDPGKGLTHL